MSDPPWFDDWCDAHTARFPGLDWGREPEQLFEGWRLAFLRNRVTRAEADGASLRAMESRVYPDGMLAALLGAIREIRGTQQDNGPIVRGADCGFCGGTGWAAVPACNRFPAGSTVPCECEMGATIHATVRDREGRPIPRLSSRPDLRARILRDRREREERGARRMAERGHDGFGDEGEVQRGFKAVTRGRLLKSINDQEVPNG